MEPTNRSPPEEEDMLSNLPGDVIVSILEKLHLREAVHLRVISRRWRCLCDQISRITLNIDDFLPDGDQGVDTLCEAADKMVDAARALLLCRRQRADGHDLGDVYTASLAMRFYLRYNYRSLGRQLEDAVASGKAHAAELTITTTCTTPCDGRESTDRSMARYGRRFRVLFDACPAAFQALTKLTMEKMRHDWPNDLRDILATCTRLEKLSLIWCHGLGQRTSERWDVRHARLRDITIYCCSIAYVDLTWLPRLERFSFKGWSFPKPQQNLVFFGQVPRLTTVTLSNNTVNCERAIKLSPILYNTSISDLHLNFCAGNIWVQPEIPRRLTDVFRNLKNLRIRNVHRVCGLTWIMFLLQSAPHLQGLYIKLMDHDCNEHARKKIPWEVATSFKHYSLAGVTILVFYAIEDTAVVTFIQHLIEAAVNLKEICIRENAAASFCKSCGYTEPRGASRFPQTDQDRDAFRQRITDGRSATTTFKVQIQSALT